MAKKLHRFITEYKISGDKLEIVNPDIVHQIKNVLKLRAGEICIVARNGIEYECEIRETGNSIVFTVREKRMNDKEPKNKVHLYMSILKKENFEIVVQKASEMGITEITPIVNERTVKTNLNTERLEKIGREASELSGRSVVTKINEIQNFKDAIKKDSNENKILFDISGKNFKHTKQSENISIYVGPEGGFTEDEINTAREHSATIASLGQLTLRGETAGILASYIALNL